MKTPVQIVQELIAVHTSRIEWVQKCEDKLMSAEASFKFAAAKQQSEKYTAQLLSELSEFGDAVMASVDNQNEFQVKYRQGLGQLDSLSPQEAEQMFNSLEEALKNTYQSIMQTGVGLPASLQEIITRHT